MVRLQTNGLGEILDRPLVLAQVTVGNTPVVVNLRVVRVQFNGLVIVLYGPLVLAQVTVGLTPLVVMTCPPKTGPGVKLDLGWMKG